jgi:hypothetical protein
MKLKDEDQVGWKEPLFVRRHLDPKHRCKVTAWQTGVESGMNIWDIHKFSILFRKKLRQLWQNIWGN